MYIKLEATDGVTKVAGGSSGPYHQLSVVAPGATAGSLVLRVRGPGSTTFEDVPDGTVDLTDPKSVLYTFLVHEFELTLSGVADASYVEVQDNLIKGV